MSDAERISHALILPDRDFDKWFQAARAYAQAFERVAIVRSPAGNDINRYRDVTAVQAPLTWYRDSALEHIRRFYPMVVRVDVIPAKTPEDLAKALQKRIADKDRFGAKQNNPVHIYDRFILEWPTDYRPMRITRKFVDAPGLDKDHEGIDIAASAGARVLAAADGVVTRQWALPDVDDLGYSQYVQVTSTFNNQTYITTYVGLGTIEVPLGTVVKVGDVLGTSARNSFKLILQRPGAGMSDFRIPDVLDPTHYIYIDGFRVTPTANGVRVRHLPDAKNGQVIGQVNTFDMLDSLENHGRALTKIGVEGEWLRVRTPDGKDGYAAAWFLQATQKSASGLFDGINILGVNLDQLHPLGTPDPSRLGGIGWVRFGYNVSNNSGSEDIVAAYDRYARVVEKYVKAGYKVLFATSHQTYGEGKNEFWPWPSMTDQKWDQLIPRFADMMGRIAKQWASSGMVHCWQVWNEQDAPIGAVASVPMLAHNYGKMLTQTIRAIRASDPKVYIITGGHTSGPVKGSQYARNALSVVPFDARPDGIAFHPYGRGINPGPPYAIFGHIDEEIQYYGPIMPDKPLWITEWGVLDRGNDNPKDIADYALGMIRHLKVKYPGRIAALIWYAWAETMHNGYGIVGADDRPRPPLTEMFLKA